MFENLKTDENVQDTGDFIGGNYVLDSNVYDMTIDLAYVDVSQGGAMSLNLHAKDALGNNLKSTLWMTSGTAKGCQNFYVDSKGTKRYLPGFDVANSICLLSIGKEVSELATEEKVIQVYNPDLKKEAPTKKQVFVDLLGAEISLGIIKQVADKNAKNDQGTYVPTGETREENEIDKAFRTSDKFTTTEIKAGATEAVFMQKWLDKNKGTIRDKTKGTTAGNGTGAVAGNTAAAANSSQAAPAKKSLFAQ